MKLATREIKLSKDDYKKAIGRAAVDSFLLIALLGLIAYFVLILI